MPATINKHSVKSECLGEQDKLANAEKRVVGESSVAKVPVSGHAANQ